MKLAIVEDNEIERNHLSKLLKDWLDYQSLSATLVSYSSGEEFLLDLKETVYDIVFMDIFMGGINGVNTAELMRKSHIDSLKQTLLIFITSSSEFHPDAFSLHAFDYIKKPVDKDRLSLVLSDCLAILPMKHPYIKIPVDKHSVSILYSDIISVTADLHHCIFKTTKEKRFRIPFREISETLLIDKRFFLAIRGIIVNLDHVKNIGERDLTMDNNDIIPFNVRKKSSLKQALVDRQFYLRKIRNMRGVN